MTSHARRSEHQCPECDSRQIVQGGVLGASDDGWATKFFPSGLKFFTLSRSVSLVERRGFKACAQCGHIWARLDAGALRELIEHSGTPETRRKLDSTGAKS
jgi:ribosomal protein L37AE/L43A